MLPPLSSEQLLYGAVFFLLKLGKLSIAALLLEATAKANLAAVHRAGAAAAHYEIVYVHGFDNVAADIAPDNVFKYFLQISPVPFQQQFLPKP